MKKLIHTLVLACLLPLHYLQAEEITLDLVLAHAVSESPVVKSIDAKLAAQIADAIETEMLPNPVFDVEMRYPANSPGVRPDSEIEAAIEQPFRLSHLGLRDTVAKLIRKASGITQKLELLEYTQKVRLSYLRLWSLEQQMKQIEAASKRVNDITVMISDASKRGAIAQSDAGLFLAQAKRLSAERLGLTAALKAAEAELQRTANFALNGRSLARPAVDLMLDESQMIESLEKGQIPVQKRYALVAKLAEEQVHLAERDAFPLLAPRMVYQHTGDGADQYGLGIRVELPFTNRNQAERERSRAREAAAKADSRYYTGESFRNEVSLLMEAIKASREQAEMYRKEVIPLLLKAAVAGEEQLRAGQTMPGMVFQVQKELLDASLRSAELWVKAVSQETELTILLGWGL